MFCKKLWQLKFSKRYFRFTFITKNIDKYNRKNEFQFNKLNLCKSIYSNFALASTSIGCTAAIDVSAVARKLAPMSW